jgi:hypothetical protein
MSFSIVVVVPLRQAGKWTRRSGAESPCKGRCSPASALLQESSAIYPNSPWNTRRTGRWMAKKLGVPRNMSRAGSKITYCETPTQFGRRRGSSMTRAAGFAEVFGTPGSTRFIIYDEPHFLGRRIPPKRKRRRKAPRRNKQRRQRFFSEVRPQSTRFAVAMLPGAGTGLMLRQSKARLWLNRLCMRRSYLCQPL